MNGYGLMEVWGGSGCFGVVRGVSTVLLTDQIRKRVCLAL